MEKKKILYLNDFGHSGGAQKVLLYVAQIVDRKKYDVEFLFGCDGEIYDRIKAMGFKANILALPHLISWDRNKLMMLPLNMLFFLKPFFQLALYIKESDADIVITNSIKYELVGSIVARIARKRLFWHTHNIQPVGVRRKVIQFFASYFPEKIIAVSQAVKKSYANTKAYSKIVVVRNGISTERHNFNRVTSDSQFTVLMLSMITSWKGHKTLIDAIRILEKKKLNKDIKVLFAGGTDKPKDHLYEKELHDYAADDLKNGRLKFLGKVTDIERLLAESNVLVNLSHRADPFPTVLLEAFSQGVPCIATNIGGQSEIVIHERNGLLIEPNNPQQLAEAILYCKKKPDVLKTFSSNCRVDFEENYTLQHFGKRYNAALDRLVSESDIV